jgi:hypothetical protein
MTDQNRDEQDPEYWTLVTGWIPVSDCLPGSSEEPTFEIYSDPVLAIDDNEIAGVSRWNFQGEIWETSDKAMNPDRVVAWMPILERKQSSNKPVHPESEVSPLPGERLGD